VISAGMDLEIITDPERMHDLATEWTRLALANGPLAIFRTFEWQRAWWENHDCAQNLRLLVLREAGILIAILPLYIADETSLLGKRVRVLKFVGTGADTAPDYLGPLVKSERASDAARVFLDAIREMSGWDVVCLTDILVTDSLLALLRADTTAIARQVIVRQGSRIPVIRLTSTLDTQMRGLSRKLRYTIRASRARFESAPNARFRISDAAHLDRDLDSLIDLHRTRMARKGQVGAFSSPEFNRFHRDVLHTYQRRGWLRLCVLEIDRKPIAIHYNYAFGGTWFHFQSGISEEFSKLSPGTLLTSYVIGAALAEGATELDLLQGEHGYKQRWATDHRATANVLAWRHTLAGTIWALRNIYLPRLRSSVRRVMRTGAAGFAS